MRVVEIGVVDLMDLLGGMGWMRGDEKMGNE